MVFPPNLQQGIEKILKRTKYQQLKYSSAHITNLYQEGKSLTSKEDLTAYLTVRMPATYASISTVLKQIPFSINSLLDLGAGPGTGWWAARMQWGKIKATCVEKEPFFIDLGKELGAEGYVLGDIETIPSYEPHDLALFGYSLGELSNSNLETVWRAVKCVVIVEPGTPNGFQRLLAARDQLIELGGYVLAPCPHSEMCPHPSWCHFSVRLQRSFWHRQAKQASLPYEDEKFSYVIITKESLNAGCPRIISHPEKHKGHVSLELCTLNGIEKQIISKKQKELYKKARHCRWGDHFHTT